MEFKFRAVDDRPPPTTYFSSSSSSSTVGYFSELAFRANYPNIDSRLNPELMRNQILRREIEKERIREQIIAEEIAWRQSLEAEVRRELMMEREMAIRVRGLSFEERLTMRLDPRLSFPFTNQFDNRQIEEHPAFPGRSVFDPPLQPPRLSEALVAPEAKPASEDNKYKLIVLAKPDPNLCGAKRKAATPPAGGARELLFTGLNKKPKEEWSCALCQVSATSERGLKEHLQGKKHKAKEARLRAIKMAKKPSILPLPKDTTKQAKLTSSTGGSELEAEVEGTLQVENSNDTDEKIGSKEDAGNGNDKMSRQKNERTRKLRKKGTEKLQKEEKTAEFRKKKFKFWCEMCQIGAYCAMAMEAHKKGKKHAARLQELHRNGESEITMASSKAGEKAKDAEAGTENANEKMTETVVHKNKTTEPVADSEKITDNVFEDAV